MRAWAVGLACGLIILLLVRIATGGTFVRFVVDLDSPGSMLALTAGGLVTASAAVLAVSIVVRPRPPAHWAAVLFGVCTVPFALALLAVGHASATVVAALGLLIIGVAVYNLYLIKPPASGR